MGAYALLAGSHEVASLEPFKQRYMAAFENRSDLNRELLAAFATLAKTGACALALQFINTANIATMRADWTSDHSKLSSFAMAASSS